MKQQSAVSSAYYSARGPVFAEGIRLPGSFDPGYSVSMFLNVTFCMAIRPTVYTNHLTAITIDLQ